jgi:ClpP class serine protease
MGKLNLLDLIDNNPKVHQQLIEKIEDITKRNLVCYVAVRYIVEAAILDEDAEMLENLFRFIEDRYGGKLDLLIQSPGGDPLAAGKIIENIRTYFPAEFRVIVPSTAMSAATLVTMGADTAVMSDTSRLGPVDPQMQVEDPRGSVLQPAWSFVKAYDELIEGARNDIIAGLKYSPHLHLLNNQNPSWIQICKQARASAKSLAIECLEKGLMKGKTRKQIEDTVEEFIKLGETEGHGRVIRYQQAQVWGLNITYEDKLSELWNCMWELYTRISKSMMRNNVIKYLIYRDDSYAVMGPK